LTGYNQLEAIAPEVSEAFVEIIDNKSVIVQIDKSFILVSFEYRLIKLILIKNHHVCKNNKKIISI